MAHGLVFNIQRYSVHDGPGIRTTVFLKGCSLNCAWCHNPESIAPQRETVVLENRCIRCGECLRVCPVCEDPCDEGVPVPATNCTRCGACVEVCPTTARQIIGTEMSSAEVLQVALRDRVFYEESGGGVTFSGGEPLLQPAFLVETLGACRSAGLHTAVDTCGMVSTEDLLAVAPLTDLFLYDLKLIDEAAHLRHTRGSNRQILANLRALGEVHSRIWLRVPLVPGVNDDRAALEASARFAAGVPGVCQVNVLPYHGNGVAKSFRLGRSVPQNGFQTPSSEKIAEAVAIFREQGLTAKAGG